MNIKSGIGIDLTVTPGLATITARSQATIPSPAARVFATPNARGFYIHDGKQISPTMVEENPEIRISHEDDKNKITVFDKDGKPSWTNP